MRAIQISSFGKSTDVLKLVDIPEPPALVSVELPGFEEMNGVAI